MISTYDKAIAAVVVSGLITWITQRTGLAVPMEWAAYATTALAAVLTGFFVWLTPNKT
jgi:hypothetical protein